MEVTDYYGSIQTCRAKDCQCKDLVDYETFTPPFASSFDSLFIGWCKDHEKEGKEYLASLKGSKDRINQASSNS